MKLIIDLPADDIWPIIFKNLSINDLFTCRLVNKQFKYFSDHTDGINKLVIGLQNYESHLYYNDQLINDNEIISLECFRSIKLLSIFNLDKYLKYLKICDHQLKLEEISNLINLKYLELDCFYNYEYQIINLNNLKVLVSKSLDVKLNTPKLEKIQFYNINRVQFDSNPQSIKHLITYNYDNKLEKFENLEIIELKDNNQSINENLLIIFKNLKKFKFNLKRFKFNLNFDEIDYSNEQLKNSLIKILNDKIKLRRELDIYLEDVKIENIDILNELSDQNSVWKFRINNYDQLDSNLSSINHLNYEELVRCVNNIKTDLPATFFREFQYIKFVSVEEVDDVDNLSWFLNNLRNLTTLTIGSSLSLDEAFYNNLSDSIKYLHIYSKSDINYDFISKLSKLIEFLSRIDKDLFDLAFELFKNLKYLKKFEFCYDENQIKIEKEGKYFYLNDAKLDDYNQLITECNKFRLK